MSKYHFILENEQSTNAIAVETNTLFFVYISIRFFYFYHYVISILIKEIFYLCVYKTGKGTNAVKQYLKRKNLVN